MVIKILFFILKKKKNCCDRDYLLKLFIFVFFALSIFLYSYPSFCKRPLKDEKKTYEWPALPDETILKKGRETKSENGLVVLERISEINIGGIFAWLNGKPSVVKEEFIRFLIIDQNGVKNAESDIEAIFLSKVEEVDARTILPDGKIINIDKKNDIEMVELETLKSKKIFFSAGKVKFPSPQVGAILDIHYRIISNALVLSWLEPLSYNKLPTMKLKMKFAVSDTGIGWQVITLNTTKQDILKMIKSGEVELNMNDILPTKEEPLAPPSYYYQPYILAFSNFLDKKEKNTPGTWTSEIIVDNYWLPQPQDIEKTPFKPYWSNFFDQLEKEKTNFMKDAQNNKIEFLSSDLMQLPVLERAQRVFSLVQETIIQSNKNQTKNRFGGGKSTFAQSLKYGFEGKTEIAFFISYLFDKYQIPHQDGVIINRYRIRFSPFIPNAYIFDPVYAIKILESNSKTIILTGDLNIPFGSLDSEFQNSIFVYKDSKGTICLEKTPENDLGADAKKYFYEFKFNDDLTYEGKIILEEKGSCANDLTEYLQNSIRTEEKRKKEKKNIKSDNNKENEEKEKLVKNELEIANNKLKIDNWEILRIPSNSKETLKIEYKVTGSLEKESIGDLIFIFPIPFLGGYSSTFLEERRLMPIWFQEKEVDEFEGTLVFPKNMIIEDIAQNESFQFQEDLYFSFESQKIQSENENILKVKFISKHPLFSSAKEYHIVKHFYSLVTKILNNKIVIRKDNNVK